MGEVVDEEVDVVHLVEEEVICLFVYSTFF